MYVNFYQTLGEAIVRREGFPDIIAYIKGDERSEIETKLQLLGFRAGRWTGDNLVASCKVRHMRVKRGAWK